MGPTDEGHLEVLHKVLKGRETKASYLQWKIALCLASGALLWQLVSAQQQIEGKVQTVTALFNRWIN